MAAQQYDVSKKIQRLFQEKQKIRQAIRQEVLRREHSPYVKPDDLNDPAVLRYHAMLQYRAEHVRPNRWNVGTFCCMVVFPMLLTYYTISTHEEEKEKLLRSGAVAYKDRRFKHVM